MHPKYIRGANHVRRSKVNQQQILQNRKAYQAICYKAKSQFATVLLETLNKRLLRRTEK